MLEVFLALDLHLCELERLFKNVKRLLARGIGICDGTASVRAGGRPERKVARDV